jgi:hypothetical protein
VRAGANDVIFGIMLAISAILKAQTGSGPEACASLREAIAHSNDKGDRPVVATGLDYGIQVLATLREFETAAVVAGAVRGESLARIDTLPAYEVQYREQALEAVRTALGDERYEAALERGGAMTFDEIVAYALGELDRIVS